ncbi:MAG: S1 RNA-binding domain-containing protein [Bradymonadaceae bacterium]
MLVDAHESGAPVEGKVTGTNKGGFEVKVHGVDAFCPISQIELGFTEDKEPHVGATYRFKVSEVEDSGDTVVLSRAELLQEERAEKAKETLESLEEGQVVEGIVTRTTDFGAFVDLGGVEGLIHVSELSHGHVDDPAHVVGDGEKVEVEILDIEMPDDEDDNPRIGLSRKSTETDPWAKVNEEFAVGDEVEGEVVRNAPFGSFVEIAPGVEGLVHVSEMSWTEHVKTPDDVVAPGEKVTVQIQDIDIADRRVGLSMREAKSHPWDDVRDEYMTGEVVEGEVENIEDFGVFVQLPTGITALIPRSEMSLPSGATPFRVYSQGETIEARILNIDESERKMALTPLDESEEDDEASDEGEEGQAAETPSPSEASDSGGGFGSLGDMIGDQLKGDEE